MQNERRDVTTLESNTSQNSTQLLAKLYDQSFFKEIEDCTRTSATAVVPLLLELVHPNSVVDIGCGTGIWLKEFCRHGITDFQGVDGAYALDAEMYIPRERFTMCDLEGGDPQLNKQFDLALSLEVAEHLSPDRASSFVSLLCRLAPVVVFSAAIPFQLGVNHINEQWPFFWEDLFLANGFAQLDVLRPRLWKNRAVALWYQQNILVYATKEQAKTISANASFEPEDSGNKLHLVREEVIRRMDGNIRDLTKTIHQLTDTVHQLTNIIEVPNLRQSMKLQLRLPLLALKAFLRHVGIT